MAADGETRTEKFPFGIASVGLGEVERQVPLDEPPPLPPNAALNVIGKPTPRQNGRAKVTGATRYTVDIVLPGMLTGRISALAAAARQGSRDRRLGRRAPSGRARRAGHRPTRGPGPRNRALRGRARRRCRRRFAVGRR